MAGSIIGQLQDNGKRVGRNVVIAGREVVFQRVGDVDVVAVRGDGDRGGVGLCLVVAGREIVPLFHPALDGHLAAQDRGRLFIGPGVEVYEGMIVGANPKNEDMVVNVCKKKHVTNTRAAGSDEALKLTPHSVLSLEQSLEFIGDDELVEVTPKSIRMRKMILNKEKRLKAQSRGE